MAFCTAGKQPLRAQYRRVRFWKPDVRASGESGHQARSTQAVPCDQAVPRHTRFPAGHAWWPGSPFLRARSTLVFSNAACSTAWSSAEHGGTTKSVTHGVLLTAFRYGVAPPLFLRQLRHDRSLPTARFLRREDVSCSPVKGSRHHKYIGPSRIFQFFPGHSRPLRVSSIPLKRRSMHLKCGTCTDCCLFTLQIPNKRDKLRF